MDEIMEWLCKFAYDHNIEVTIDNVHFSSSVPSSCFGKHVIINMNWDNEEEIPFIFAHEIGHVLNGNGGVLYYSTITSQTKIESAANDKAIELIIEYGQEIDELPADYITFMQSYHIPAFLDDKVRQRYNNN